MSFMFYRRKDAKLIDKEIPVFNRMIPYLMKGKNESIITLKESIIMTKTLNYINEERDDNGKKKYNYFTLLIAAVVKTIIKYPRMNRFIMGGHYYQRNKISIAFVIKTSLSIDSPERNVIVYFDEDDNLDSISDKISKAVVQGKSIKEDEQEKVMNFLFKLPTFIIKAITSAMIKLDKWGVLPIDMTEFDALHNSVFMANLGSIGINDAPAHHLFEWGTCSLFITSGRIKKELVVCKRGETSIEDVLNVCFSIDERIADGFYYSKVIKQFKKYVEDPSNMVS